MFESAIGPVIADGKEGYLDEVFCGYAHNCVCKTIEDKTLCTNLFGVVYHTHPSLGKKHLYPMDMIKPIEKLELDDAVYLRK